MVIDLKKIKTAKYDNQSAYEELQVMMKQDKPISVRFGVKDNYPCVYVENRNTRCFPYQIKEKSLNGFLHYLLTGEITDFDPDPMKLDEISDEETGKYKESMFRQFVESGINIQYTPTFREYNGYITGLVTLRKGTIFLSTKRTPEFMDFLREHREIA
jgi:hypothetical protein